MIPSSLLLVALAAALGVSAETACDVNKKCPESIPCCSQYGVCGVGAYCLGGCDPRASNSLKSCVPEPVCQSKTYTFNDMTGITSKTAYLGDASTTNWVMDGEAVSYQNTLLLTMAPGTVGTVLATSDYMWYGNVKARFKTSRGRGVVTAFILLSDVKDEIDYEFVGVDLQTAQTNYYFQGITDYGNSGNISLSDTFNNYHDYEIRWTPDSITWLVDNQIGRVKYRNETWNATANMWKYPQTPSRVQISIWPGGLATNAQGTIDWAGGLIDWSNSNQDIKTNGYYYAQFQSVTVDCYNATTAPGTNQHTSYTYNSLTATNNTVVDGTDPTVLKSLLGTGTNMSADYASAVAGATQTSEIAVVPGLSGAGPGVNGHASAVASGTTTGATDAATAAVPATGTGFSQGGSTAAANSKSQGAALAVEGRKMLGSSIFAGVVAVAVLLAL